jgi:hypothetical protein
MRQMLLFPFQRLKRCHIIEFHSLFIFLTFKRVSYYRVSFFVHIFSEYGGIVYDSTKESLNGPFL